MDPVLPIVFFGVIALALSIKNSSCCKNRENEINYNRLHDNSNNSNSNDDDEIPPKYEDINNS